MLGHARVGQYEIERDDDIAQVKENGLDRKHDCTELCFERSYVALAGIAMIVLVSSVERGGHQHAVGGIAMQVSGKMHAFDHDLGRQRRY